MATKMLVDQLNVQIHESNEALGKAAAEQFAHIIKQAVAEHGETAAILATGNSQLSFVHALRERNDIPWGKVRVFHMDEYLGMEEAHPASFRRFIKEYITDLFQPLETYGIAGDASDVEAELARYTHLLETYNPVVCVMGIGENGHLAFNDPPADFTIDKLIHVVTLNDVCRRQQVGEGHFATFDDVPEQAISLTIPALLRPKHVLVLVPESRKAPAVRDALYGPITEDCPASILRTQNHATVYLDRDSSALISQGEVS